MQIKATYTSIWKLSYPIMIGLVAHNLMNVIDTAFLGRLGEVAIGAGAIGGLFYFAVITLGIGFSTGAQIIIGRRNGEKNYNEIGDIFYHSLYFLLLLAILIFALISWGSPYLFNSFLKSHNICVASNEFLFYRKWAVFFSMINLCFNAFYIGTANTKVLTISTSITAFVNIILDYCLIFGNWGFPRLEIGGAALASTIAEICTTAFYIIYTYKIVDYKLYNIFRFGKINFSLFNRLMNVSVPVMLQNFLSFSGWFAFFMIVEQLGERALAISNISRSIYMIFMIPLWGFSSASNSLVSNLIGQGKYYKVNPVIKKVAILSFFSTLILILPSSFFIEKILSIYTNNIDLIKSAIPTVFVIFGALLFFSISFIMFSGVNGTGNTKISFRIEIITISSYIISVYSFAIILKTPIEIVWLGEYIYFIIMGSQAFFYLKSYKWKDLKI